MSKMIRILGKNIELAVNRKYANIEDFKKDVNMVETDVCRLFEGRLLLKPDKIKEISRLTETSVSDLLDINKDYSFVEPHGKFTNRENEHKILDFIDDYIDLVEAVN